MEIGDKLHSGKPHDGRAPDYDDWSLNGDIIFGIHCLTDPLSCLLWGFEWMKKHYMTN